MKQDKTTERQTEGSGTKGARDKQQASHSTTTALLRLSYVPVLVCIVAFTRSAVYRLNGAIQRNQGGCQRFGWYSSSSAEFQCDHKPLDVHASLALMWLAVYALQVLLLATGNPKWHRRLGRLGLVVALLNCAGMFLLATAELDPETAMKKTDRPDDFTPFMFLVATKVTVCVSLSIWALYGKPKCDVEAHKLWMFRAFLSSFTTPVIRFYPLVLRLLAGTDCFQQHREKFVMGSMFVSELVCVVVYTVAQRQTRTQFWDMFMKLQAVTFGVAVFKEIYFASTHGTFIAGMAECAADKYAGDVPKLY